ncbi:TPA: hypothetical protein I7D81_002194 [Vibrio cholerae]|nr:hypothetical protein [Vibrio cholerae]HAS5229111.1 hypothetical protein [Vibrio cholerae]HAS5236836.1 hypothetical protein [Vibrio cholerae]HAS5240542.1 hypothetical protein [Vibrio cholerae]HAS5297817.1 hypothetical protein [Vibrio cholerae]
MKNKLSDLNNHLLSQLERLSDEDLKGDDLKEEIERSKAVKAIAQEIISGGKLALEAQLELGGVKSAPEMLEVKNS